MHRVRRPSKRALRDRLVPATAAVLLCLLLVAVSIAAVHVVSLDLDHGHAHAPDDCGACSAVLLAQPALDAPRIVLLPSLALAERGVAETGAQVASPRSRRAHRARAPPAHA